MLESARNAVVGGLVADAAALGTHWIYNVERVREVAGAEPEFHEPNLDDYRGGVGYFAHRGKSAGDPTHYGEQLMVALESLGATGGVLDPADYERRFVAHFGPGGSWVGYIDYATRETLRNIDDAERAALIAARDFDLGEFEHERSLMKSAVIASIQRSRGDALARSVEKGIRRRHPDNDELVSVAQAMARMVEEARGGFHGSDDIQLPAVCKLSAVVACDADVDAAVRVTNDNEASIDSGRRVAALIRTAIDGGDWRAIAREFEASGTPGPACPLPQSIPMIGRVLSEAQSGEAMRVLDGLDRLSS
jgi:ADP-ribosylglycohydrolase